MNAIRNILQLTGLLLLLHCPLLLVAQVEVSSTQLLNQYLRAPSVFPSQTRLFLENTPQGLSLVEKMEFRTETDEFDFRQQEYLFRTSFNSIKAKKAQQQLTRQNLLVQQQQEEVYQQKQLRTYYQLILSWHYLEQEMQVLNSQKAILEDKRTVYNRLLQQQLDLNLSDYLKNEEALQQQARDSLQLENLRDWVLENLSLVGSKETSAFNSEDWISIAQMNRIVEQIGDGIQQNPRFLLQQAETDFAQAEYSIEEAKSQRVVDFVQLKYKGNERLNFQQEWSIGLGLNIPARIFARQKLNEASLDILEEKAKTQLLEQSLAEKIKEKKANFRYAVLEHQQLYDQLQNNTLTQKLKQYVDQTGEELNLLFQIKENSLQHQAELLLLEKRLCDIYLDLLELSGLLTQQPMVNYLAEGLPVLTTE